MNRVSADEFSKRFIPLRDASHSNEIYQKSYYRDSLHRKNVVVFKYWLNSEDECREILNNAQMFTSPELSVQLLGHCMILPTGFTGMFNLILIYEDCQTMEDFLYGHDYSSDQELSLKSVQYIFFRVSQMLEYLHEVDTFHGNIDEAHLFVDPTGRLLMMKIPLQKTNIEGLMVMPGSGMYRASAALLSPELMVYMMDRPTSRIDSHLSNESLLKSDIFSLGLMSIRLISPKAFSEGYNLETKKIEVERLYLLIDTLGVFVDSQLASVLKHCLTVDINFRPEPSYLVEEMAFEYDNLPRRLDHGALRKRDEIIQLDSYRDTTSPSKAPPNPSFTSPKQRNTQTPTGQFTPLTSNRKSATPAYGGAVNIEPFRGVSDSQPPFTQATDARLIRSRDRLLKDIEACFFDRVAPARSKESVADRARVVYKTLYGGASVGFILYDNKDIYFGYIKNDRSHDVGLMLFSNGEVYEGEFEEGKIGGKGKLILKNGLVMNGHWQYNMMHGNFEVEDYEKKVRILCTYKKHKLILKTSVEDEGLEKYPINDPLAAFYKAGVQNTELLKELIHDHIQNKSSLDAPNPTSVGKANQRMRRMVDSKVIEAHDDTNEAPNHDKEYQVYLDQQDPDMLRNKEERKIRQEKFAKYDESINNYKRPEYENSNLKENAYERLPGRRLTTSSHKTALELLENCNRQFTYPKYYDDLYSVEKPQQLELTAQLDPVLSRTLNKSNRKVSSPQRLYFTPSKSHEVHDDECESEHHSDDSYRVNDLDGIYDDDCAALNEDQISQSVKVASIPKAARKSPGYSYLSPSSNKNKKLQGKSDSSSKKVSVSSKKESRNMILDMYPQQNSLQLPSDNDSLQSKSKEKPKKRQLKDKSKDLKKKKASQNTRPLKTKPKEADGIHHLSKIDIELLDLTDLKNRDIKSKPTDGYEGYAWIKFKDGSKFYGFFVSGQATGNGTFTTSDRKKIDGRWKRGKFVN